MSARVCAMLTEDRQRIENHLAWNPEEYRPKQTRQELWNCIVTAALAAQQNGK